MSVTHYRLLRDTRRSVRRTISKLSNYLLLSSFSYYILYLFFFFFLLTSNRTNDRILPRSLARKKHDFYLYILAQKI